MGALISGIIGGAGGLGKVFKDIVGTFKIDPTKKAELQAVIDSNEHEVQMKEMELQAKLQEAVTKEIETASSNIRAEAQSGDKYTSRSRPSFIYMMLVIMLSNYMVFPLIGKPPITFPEPLFWLFGSCMLGYTGARTWEKIGIGKKEGV
jgi:hypothetical protein